MSLMYDFDQNNKPLMVFDAFSVCTKLALKSLTYIIFEVKKRKRKNKSKIF